MRGRSITGFVIIVVIFVVLLVVVLGRNKASKKEYDDQQAASTGLVFPDLNVGAISQITITSLYHQVVEMRKMSGYWMVAQGGEHSLMDPEVDAAGEDTGDEAGVGETEDTMDIEETPDEPRWYRGDETRIVDGLIKNIENLERGVRASNVSDTLEETFQVGDALGIEVTVKDSSDNVLAHFFVGKAADQMSTSNYIRYDDYPDHTYEVKQAWKNLVGGPLEDWRDKSLFFSSFYGITSLEIIGGDEGDLSFLKNADGIWTTEAEWEVDGNKVERVIEKMSQLKAESFGRVPNPEITGLEDPKWRVVTLGDEGRFELLIGSVGDGGLYHCSTNEDDSIFMVKMTLINEVFVGADKLEMTAAPMAAPGAVPQGMP